MEVPPGMEDTAGISGHASQEAVYAVCVIFTLLMGLMVIARMCTRVFIARQTGLDDGFIVLAAVFSLMYCITTYNQAEQGMGLHVWDPAIDKVAMSVFFWCALWSYYAALGFTKLSILLQYLRIFPQETFRKACFCMIGVTVLWTLWAVFSSMIMCVPIHAFWTTTDFFHDPRCLPRMETWYANSAINFVTDLIVTLLPIGVIRSLEVPKRQKDLLYLVFCIGLVTCLIGALRCIFIYPIMTNMDQTWHSPMFSIWSAVEINVAILCSCAPTLKGLVQRVWPQFLASLGSKYGSRGSRGRSGREDSDATAVATNNSASSGDDNSLHKSKDICEVESQSPKRPSPTLLGFRRSLFKPFSSTTHSSLASCYGGSKSDDEDVLFDNMARAPSRKGNLTPTKARHEEHGIEVQTSVDQFVMVKFEPKPEPEAHKTLVGSGPHARDPFDDDQEERDIQRAAWSSS